MTSEQIGLRRDEIRRQGLAMPDTAGVQGASYGMCFWLAEIAYQLAKANERNEAHDGQ